MAHSLFHRRNTTYRVCITVHEARHLRQNANPVVVVKVGHRKRKSIARERTDSPVFNEYFVFDLTAKLSAFLATRISIAIYLRDCIGRLDFYAGIVFDLATIWEQADHRCHRKWLMLTNPRDPSGAPMGYLKCTMVILAKGETTKAQPKLEADDDIEGNLFPPLAGGSLALRQRARYVFAVYRADGLPEYPGGLCTRATSLPSKPYVEISFAGLKGRTSYARATRARGRFDERIVFRETFPPLSNRIRLALKHRPDGCRKRTLATRILDLRDMSNSGEYGFLPTYGPSFLHMYGPGCGSAIEDEWHRGLPPYRGRVLLSLRTEMDDPDASPGKSVETELTEPIAEKNLWSIEDYSLVAVIYDVSMIDRRKYSGKPLCFEVSIGDVGGDQAITGTASGNRTVPRATATLDGKYNYLPLGTRKALLHLPSRWPNLEWRMRNTNSISFIADFLAESLEKLEQLAAVRNGRGHELYNRTIRTLRQYCQRYLKFLGAEEYLSSGGTTSLDRHRVNVCRKAIEDILRTIDLNGELLNDRYIEIATVHAYKYLRKLEGLRKDPQDGLPDVFVWMLARSSRVACARIPAESIIYSEEPTGRGKDCGALLSLPMAPRTDRRNTGPDSACIIEIFLWFGNAKFIKACWSAIPPGYLLQRDDDAFPRYLEYTETSSFQLRAHIFQGRFEPGMYASELLDPLLAVTFRGYTSVSRSIGRCLEPLWDQTLVFPVTEVCGSAEYVKRTPPRVTLQLFDEDLCGSKVFCGRCEATPTVKLAGETYSPPNFPPTLSWYGIESKRDGTSTAAILAAFELIQTSGNGSRGKDSEANAPTERIHGIPSDIRPKMAKYRIEVIFWGVRDMRRIGCMPVLKPRIVIECAGLHVKSEVMENARKFPNFEQLHIVVQLDMPELEIYYPGVSVKAYDSRGFGRFKYLGICTIPTVRSFVEEPITEEKYRMEIYEVNSIREKNGFYPVPESSFASRVRRVLKGASSFYLSRQQQRTQGSRRRENYRDESLDWWSKYHASIEAEKRKELGVAELSNPSGVATFEIYPTELETQPEFQAFEDRLASFQLWRGRRTCAQLDDGSGNFAGSFKGHIAVYRWPHPEALPCKTRSGRDAANGLCDDYPSQEPVQLLLRLYVVKGINLHPSDPLTGKSDPYIVVRLGPNTLNDRKNYIPNQLNPTFGRLFEFEATLPRDYMLRIQVWDHDLTSSDDFIGETRIDIENRFYSRHRASCGISREYNPSGYNAWRDREKPKQILEFLCRKNNLPGPIYREDGVRIANQWFPGDAFTNQCDDQSDREESMALRALHRWQEFPVCGCALLPEHIERRPLFNAEKPGLVQGTLELWVDMFQAGHLPPKPATNIAPQTPEEYEIRVIVWNTEDVPLVDRQFLTGEKCSDIYVKGWIVYDDHQRTDVHYNSLTGEGNFNWRFVFRVRYLRSERVIVVRKKSSIMARHETEEKVPCRLHLQVWDSDHLSADDFLGSLTLDLSRMPRGSSNPKNCTTKLLLGPQLPTVNLFEIGRTRGWWPFTRTDNGKKATRAGKVELEITVLRAVEANAKPVGRARDSPRSLPAPSRPETSFSWFRNPWKAFRFIVCRYYRCRIISCLLCLMLLLLLVCAIYAFPGYLVKRLLRA